jgi:outer membrane protein insertion porin family
MNRFLFTFLLAIISTAALAQVGSQPKYQLSKSSLPVDSLSYLEPKDYIIGGVTISVTKNLEKVFLHTI